MGLARELEIRESASAESLAAVVQQLRSIAEQHPDEMHAQINLIELLRSQRGLGQVEGSSLETSAVAPEAHAAHLQLATAFEMLGEFDDALKELDRAVASAPADARVHNSRAWFLATCADRKIRDGKRAVADARRAVDLSHGDDPSILDTLAAAFAEVGDFPEAVKYQAKAVSLEQRGEFKNRLSLYEKQIPYHDPAPRLRR